MTIAQTQDTTSVSNEYLFSLIQALADNKYWLGRRYAEWCTAAPTLEAAVAAAAMAQDEIGHARSLYPMFRQFTGTDVEPEDRTAFHSVSTLDQPFSGWTDFVATNFLLDTALTILFEAGVDSAHDDFRNRARRISGEEQLHWLHGRGWVKRLASESHRSKAALENALQAQWPEVVMWFGDGKSCYQDQLAAAGIINADSSSLRKLFIAKIGEVATEAALELGYPDLVWDQWDRERSRLKT